jgi:hypothetical protein
MSDMPNLHVESGAFQCRMARQERADWSAKRELHAPRSPLQHSGAAFIQRY